MSEREWQPGASDTGDARGERNVDGADVEHAPRERAEGAPDDANNVEGVQGAQGGTVRRESEEG